MAGRDTGENERHSTTINSLTDNVILDIFDFYRHSHGDTLWEWHVLVHVCRRWRRIIFESPRRLDLKIRCTTKTPVRKDLGIWPGFPIAIDFYLSSIDSIPSDAISALEHTDRVGYLKLDLTESQLEMLATMASKPFPMITHLFINVDSVHAPLLHDNFLGGSAPHLQTIDLRNIVFPALQRLLLSASDLVELQLRRISPASYISPVEMAMSLAELPRLKTLVLRFQLAFFPVDPIRPPPATRTILPALTTFEFAGTSVYLEDFVAQIDCPRLSQVGIAYQSWAADFQLAQLSGFFNLPIYPFRHAKAHVNFHGFAFELYPTNRTGCDSHPATTVISFQQIGRHIFPTLNEFSVLLSTVIVLKLVGKSWASDEYNLKWLHFLRQLSSLQALCVSPPLAEKVGHALKSVKGEMVAEALPSLDLICIEDQISSIEEFVAVRQLSDRPLTVVGTEAEFDQRLSGK